LSTTERFAHDTFRTGVTEGPGGKICRRLGAEIAADQRHVDADDEIEICGDQIGPGRYRAWGGG